ncbi:cytochrome P450 26C1 isoform 3-T5 [Syngnathus typhle]
MLSRARGGMFRNWHLADVQAVTGALTWLLCALLTLALTRLLWSFRWRLTRDPRNPLPLPQGSMGWPLVGETLHWLVEGSDFHVCRRRRHGNVFKTHLLGKPVIRVTGAENIRKILMGEHSLVHTQWPRSTRIILGPNTLVNSTGDAHKSKRKVLAKVFSRGALESYLPRLQLDEEQVLYLGAVFEQLMDNLFSLPVDVPLSGLRKGIKAREILHAHMEDIIAEKMEQQQPREHLDAFDFMLASAKEHGHNLSIQELKPATSDPSVRAFSRNEDETAVELIFAAHYTTASASTSLLLQLLSHPTAVRRLQAELESEGLTSLTDVGGCPRANLSLDKLSRLRYLDCVIKEVLRFLPPVSGGYRTALRTFELDGYQVPKGWSIMYSIRDTHETAGVFQAPELFDPDRFGPDREENRLSRFSYVPFGGGVRSCVGKELAQMVLKTLAVELVATCKWTLATRDLPKMQTVPIVHPVDGLHVRFTQNQRLG